MCDRGNLTITETNATKVNQWLVLLLREGGGVDICMAPEHPGRVGGGMFVPFYDAPMTVHLQAGSRHACCAQCFKVGTPTNNLSTTYQTCLSSTLTSLPNPPHASVRNQHSVPPGQNTERKDTVGFICTGQTLLFVELMALYQVDNIFKS